MNDKYAAFRRCALMLASVLLHSTLFADSLVEGSVDAGQNKSVICGACHGGDGNSVNPTWPSIAGQHARYSYAQLQAFKNGTRKDPLMSSQAMLLTDEDMQNVAVFFESQTAAAKAVADPSTVDKGERLYRGGDSDNAVSACLACHGPTGRGNPAASYPSIRGQYATYTAKQLRDYASGARRSDGPTKVMRDIAKRLSEEDIVAVASYIQGLH